MKAIKTNLIAAAATAASTALFATTVAMDPATAATFTLKPEPASYFAEKWTIVSESADSVADLWSEAGKPEIREGWEVLYGEESLSLEMNGVVWKGGVGGGIMYLGGIYVYRGFVDWIGLIDEYEYGTGRGMWTVVEAETPTTVPEPSDPIALGVLGLGAVASRLRRRSK